MLSEFHNHAPPEESFREAVLEGLGKTPKSVPSKWIYDERGSRLFEAVCEAPEYYPTRTEMAILGSYAHEIAALTGPDCALVEFGCGASHKVRLLLDALTSPAVYVPVDIDGETLRRTAETTATDYPEIAVEAVRADLTRPFPLPVAAYSVSGVRLGIFPGGTIGNFETDQAHAFFGMCAQMLKGGGLVVGVDLQKDRAVIEAAYNDSHDACPNFNLNLLHRINAELNGNLDTNAFRHSAIYDEARGCMNIGIESTCHQSARIAGQDFHFEQQEIIRTQVSYKYTVESFQALAAQSGFEPLRAWLDDANLFSLHYFRAP
jgi:dimethylhistidine N-methyltransferase